MPVSSHACLPFVVHELEVKLPERILDLGIGYGMYGAAIRNWIQPLMGARQIWLEGVEGWPKYRTPMWEFYDIIHNGLIQKFTPRVGYDAIILADVIEHFEIREGRRLLETIKGWLNKGGILIVSTPGVFVKQEAWGGNELEIHRSLWDEPELEASDMTIIKSTRDSILGEKMIVSTYKNRRMKS